MIYGRYIYLSIYIYIHIIYIYIYLYLLWSITYKPTLTSLGAKAPALSRAKPPQVSHRRHRPAQAPAVCVPSPPPSTGAGGPSCGRCRRWGRHLRGPSGSEECWELPDISMGWLFMGKSTGNHRFSHEIWDFPVICPLNQSIEYKAYLFRPMVQGISP